MAITLFPARNSRYIVPSDAISIERGAARGVVSIRPSSGVGAFPPVPANVEITPVFESIFRTRLLLMSQIRTLSALSRTILWGWFSCAAFAGPPSPL
jgi:hypothetical protein